MLRLPRSFSRLTTVLILLVLLGLTAFFAFAVADSGDIADSANPTGEPTMSTVRLQVQTVEVLIAESFPPQIFAHVTAIIPDSCTKAREPEISRDGSTITIVLIGERPDGVACAQIISTYDKSIGLGTLDPGRYTLHVNDVSQEFEVQ
jgi:hypothetical protein